MKILLDIDGVMVITPSWRIPELHFDGFLKFNEQAAKNLASIIDQTNAEIVLTTTHRISYSIDQWLEIFQARGINPVSVTKINDAENLSTMFIRSVEIKNWVDNGETDEKYVVIDDDLSINDLPDYIKDKCVLTKPMIGLDNEAMEKVLEILSRI
ncbi:hypothetical protein D3C80_1347840 [compost metagenome]